MSGPGRSVHVSVNKINTFNNGLPEFINGKSTGAAMGRQISLSQTPCVSFFYVEGGKKPTKGTRKKFEKEMKRVLPLG